MQIIVINQKAFKYEDDVLTPLDDGAYKVKKESEVRTLAQNRAMHLYFTELANALNDAGYDIPTVIKAGVSITPFVVKEFLWKPIQKAVLGKKSTTSLQTKEVTLVYENLNRIVGEKFGVSVSFPSVDELILKQY